MFAASHLAGLGGAGWLWNCQVFRAHVQTCNHWISASLSVSQPTNLPCRTALPSSTASTDRSRLHSCNFVGLLRNTCSDNGVVFTAGFWFVFRVAFWRGSNQTYLSSLESAFTLRPSGSQLLTHLIPSTVPNGETPRTTHGAPKGRQGRLGPPHCRARGTISSFRRRHNGASNPGPWSSYNTATRHRTAL